MNDLIQVNTLNASTELSVEAMRHARRHNRRNDKGCNEIRIALRHDSRMRK
jgi:hypothetical protein